MPLLKKKVVCPKIPTAPQISSANETAVIALG